MALDLYSPCPCGSGKKFKWCCQPIHVQIDRAFQQDADGQHDVALRTMDQVLAEHPGNPEVWGRKGQLLYMNDRVEEAEQALQKAFAINPNYPFGHLLQGMFRQNEGELTGALLLFRKAADLYDPEARDHLAQIYGMIAEAELKQNRPVAAHAALKIAVHLQPGNQSLREGLETIFSGQSRLPAVARREYTFQGPAANLPPERRGVWDQALAAAATGKLTDAARSFEQITTADPDNAAGWYYLGLARAWLGDNLGGLAALDRYVALEPDESRAAEAAALGEVLRMGQGMEDQADVVEYSSTFEIRDGQPLVALLQEWEKNRRLLVVQSRPEEQFVLGLILEELPALAGGLAGTQMPHLGAHMLLVGPVFRVWNTSRDAFEKVRNEVQQRAGPALTDGRFERGPASFSDVLAPAMVFPVGITDEKQAEERVREQIERYFEEAWIHQPLKSLNGVPPVDAAGHAELGKKLRGVVRFLEDCAAVAGQRYDFERLRRKLGLAAPGTAATAEAGPALDVAAMSAAELAGLKPDSLGDEQLERAYQAAQKLDARELAARFALALVSRPPGAGRPDRWPYYSHLIQLALSEGNTDTALDFINEGEKADCERNEGQRRNDYELRRGQILAKKGEAEQAQDVFERLIQRVPAELRYRGGAAEAMLSARQGARALQFAEQGLAEARKQNNRDSEEYFKELLSAAQKQAG
jgi:predicted Zn-dependent protease